MPRPRRDTWPPLKEIALHGLDLTLFADFFGILSTTKA
jgi:hypothetical protein